jgi:hypothetical protein
MSAELEPVAPEADSRKASKRRAASATSPRGTAPVPVPARNLFAPTTKNDVPRVATPVPVPARKPSAPTTEYSVPRVATPVPEPARKPSAPTTAVARKPSTPLTKDNTSRELPSSRKAATATVPRVATPVSEPSRKQVSPASHTSPAPRFFGKSLTVPPNGCWASTVAICLAKVVRALKLSEENPLARFGSDEWLASLGSSSVIEMTRKQPGTRFCAKTALQQILANFEDDHGKPLTDRIVVGGILPKMMNSPLAAVFITSPGTPLAHWSVAARDKHRNWYNCDDPRLSLGPTVPQAHFYVWLRPLLGGNTDTRCSHCSKMFIEHFGSAASKPVLVCVECKGAFIGRCTGFDLRGLSARSCDRTSWRCPKCAFPTTPRARTVLATQQALGPRSATPAIATRSAASANPSTVTAPTATTRSDTPATAGPLRGHVFPPPHVGLTRSPSPSAAAVTPPGDIFQSRPVSPFRRGGNDRKGLPASAALVPQP